MKRIPDNDQDLTTIQITVQLHDNLYELALDGETFNRTIDRLLKELAKYKEQQNVESHA